ncbi:MAG: autotransporter assembly complex family protein [Thermoanaerobaculia bacterium]|nr:autotransporter assembly complex family protein [Thermoanaerobaculia bacterium]
MTAPYSHRRGPRRPEADSPRRSARSRWLPTLGVLLLFLLAAGPGRADVEVDLRLSGVVPAARENVRKLLTIDDPEADVATEDRVRSLHADATREIRLALQPFGYYRPEVDASLEAQNGDWLATYRVEAGERIRLESVEVRAEGQGAADPDLVGLLWQFPLEEGDPLYQPAYGDLKDDLASWAATHGYLDAELVRSEIRVDLRRYRAEIELLFETGPRYRFGEVTFLQDVVDPDVIRGYVRFEPGDPFQVAELVRLQDTLVDSPYFSRVEVVPVRVEGEGLRVPIRVDLVPSRRQRWILGAGFGSDTGIRGRLGLEMRRINREGHRGEVRVQASEIESRYAASYLIPGPYPRTDVLRFSLGYDDLESVSIRSNAFLMAVSRSRSRGRWREALTLGYQEESFRVGEDRGSARLLTPEIAYSRSKADDRLYPLRGRSLSVRLRGAEEGLASDASFRQIVASGRWIHGVREDLRLLLRTRVGYTDTPSFRDLPPSVRFFAGGDGSVRGYDFQQLGREDEAGNVIGGETLLTVGIEVDSLFLDGLWRWEDLGRFGLAAFYDLGNASAELAEDLKAGAGMGLRWLSPVGLVRADVAWALDEEGTPFRFHITLGPEL